MTDRFQPHQLTGTPAARDIVVAQERAGAVIQILESKPHLIDGFLIESSAATSGIDGINLTAGVENLIQHGLGRKLRGWYVTDLNTSAIIYRVWTSTVDLSIFLPLATSAACKIKLVVF